MRKRLTARNVRAESQADGLFPGDIGNMERSKNYHDPSEYSNYDWQAGWDVPDPNAPKINDERDEIGFGIPKTADVYQTAKAAAILAQMYLGDEAPEEAIEDQARDFMKLGHRRILASIRRWKATEPASEEETETPAGEEAEACKKGSDEENEVEKTDCGGATPEENLKAGDETDPNTDEVPAEEGYLGGWTQAYGGASIDYAGGQTLAEGLGQAPGDVITLYAVQARDLAGDVDGILSGLEQAAAALGSGDLAAGLASLTQQLGAAQEAIDALEGDRVTQDKLEAAVEAAQAALEEQIEAVQAELETAVGQLQASIASGEADAAALEEGLAALEEALQAAETLLGGDISALEEQLGALEEAYVAADDAVMDAVEALRADNAAMTTALRLVGAAAVVALAAGAAALVVALTARKRS